MPIADGLVTALRLARNVTYLLLVVALGELIPQLQALEAYFAGHRETWLVPALALTLLGIFLLAGGGLHMALSRRLEEADRTASFRAVKQAWRAGAFFRTTRWRRFAVMAIGATAIFFGLFAAIFVLAPAGLKLLVLLLVAYVVLRTGIGFWRA